MYTKPIPITSQNLFDISLRSANAKEKKVYIYEIDTLEKFLSFQQSEEIRSTFLKNKMQVQQITNIYDISKFSENKEFVDTVMKFRYIPKNIFDIQKELLIFDDIVAIYDNREILVIQDQAFANAQKQLFTLIWNDGISPKLGFSYTPSHSFYNSIDLQVCGIQFIIWPDLEATIAYRGYTRENLQKYFEEIFQNEKEYYKNSSYIIVFIWSFDEEKMCDIWKFEQNSVDDRSGPLSNVRVYKNQVSYDGIGLASGSTLLVLGHEEKLRRQSDSLSSYLDGKTPDLPLEVANGLDFFEHNNSKKI